MELTIREIADACGGELVLRGEDAGLDKEVASVVIDSRKIEAGGVFVAAAGERVDGHRFIGKAFESGAALAITEKTPQQVEQEGGGDCSGWGSYVLVENSYAALKSIAEAYRKKLSIPVVGITGSVGKTSTKEFIASVLSEKFRVLKTEGNFNNEIGVPLTLLRIRKEHQAAVVEMGISDFGEMHRLSRMVRPNVCVMTNIGQCHLENLKSRDGILNAKSEIFDFMAPDGEICLNGDDDKLATLQEIKGHKPHFFGMGHNPQEGVTAEQVVSKGLWGSDAVLRLRRNAAEETTFEVTVPLPGIHMVLNAAAAACVAGLFGMTPEEIAAGIGKIRPVDGRNHLIRLERYTLIDDCYNANPASMKAALELLALADTPKTAILGDMFELGENAGQLHGEVGAYAVHRGIDTIVCVGTMAEEMFRAAKEACAETGDKAGQRLFYYPTREALLEALKKDRRMLVPDGGTVLVKASHGMEFPAVLKLLQEETL